MSVIQVNAQKLMGLDRRMWPIIMMIGLFGWIVMKDIRMPSEILGVFAAMGLLGLFMTSVGSPELGLYVLIAYLPFSRELVGDFGTDAYAFNLTNILTLWVFGAYVLNRSGKGKGLFQGSPLSNVILLFCALGGASLIRAGFEHGSWYIWEFVTPLKRWLTPIFFFYLALWIVEDRRVLKSAAVLIMITVGIVALMAIRDYMNAGTGSLEKTRVGAIADQPNMLAAFFVYYMFLFLGFFLTLKKSSLKTWFFLVPFLMSFRGIMVTFSRGGYLGFAAGGLGACWHKSKILFIIACAALAFAIANPWVLPKGVQYRMGMTVKSHAALGEGVVAESLDESAGNRIRIWRGAIAMVKDYPWWGVGYGAFPGYIGSYTAGEFPQVDAHNSYLLIAAEMGIPTLIVFVLVIGVGWYQARWLYIRTKDVTLRAIALGMLAGIEGLLVVNMFGSRMDDQAVSSYFWILLGLVMRGVLIEREELRQAVKVV